MQADNSAPATTEFANFVAEIQEVQSTLLAATTDLTNPLGDLVRSQIKRSQPPLCGATVLAVAKPPRAGHESGDLRRKRILLAAALEMLHVALNVHRLLVNAALQAQHAGDEDTLDRSFIGSTILAGDYCFSRAAQMAAQTDHPDVVATFALALQTVSEELLREQFNPLPAPYDETRHLLQSGARAAAQLVDLTPDEQQEAEQFGLVLADWWATHTAGGAGDGVPLTSRDHAPLSTNWQALYHWLYQQRANGATGLSTVRPRT